MKFVGRRCGVKDSYKRLGQITGTIDYSANCDTWNFLGLIVQVQFQQQYIKRLLQQVVHSRNIITSYHIGTHPDQHLVQYCSLMQGSAGRGGPGKQCHPSIGDVQASGRGYTGAVFKGLIKFKNRDKLISKLNDIILRLHPLNIKHPQNDAITSPSRYLLVTPSFLSLSVLCRVHIFFGGLVCIIIQ